MINHLSVKANGKILFLSEEDEEEEESGDNNDIESVCYSLLEATLQFWIYLLRGWSIEFHRS